MTEEQREKLREAERRRYYANKAKGIPQYTEAQKAARRIKAREYQRKKRGTDLDKVRSYTTNESAKMTLSEVAKIIGASRTTVMNIEREALQKFCDRLEAACEDMREEFYAGLESDRTGNSGGVQRVLPRPELGLIA